MINPCPFHPLSVLCCAVHSQIYNEAVTDLLTGNPIAVRRSDGALVGGREVLVEDEASVVAMLREGQARKHFAATAMNDRSSRAHTIIIFSLTQNNAKLGAAVKSQLFLVDLAGSERVKNSRVEGNQLVEATAINSSLLVLGKVISKLSRSEIHIPYFESRLTTVLKGAFGGNSRTCVIVTCRSDDKKYGAETLQSLRFGERCGMISNHTKVAATSLDAVLAAINASMHAVEKQVQGLRARGKTHIPSYKKLELKLADLRRHKENIEDKVQTNLADSAHTASEI
jgi:kinesin family protein 5